MAYRSHGRAQVNTTSPRAFARCDRCGFIYNHADLKFQFDFRGPQLQNLRILVCKPCTDNPQPQLKPIILTQDPMPVMNARPEDYYYANTQGLSTVEPPLTDPNTGISVPQGSTIVTMQGDLVTGQPIGAPVGLDPNAVMPLVGTKAYNVVIPILSIVADGTTTITVTTRGVHNLVTNDQVSVEDLVNTNASGMFSITTSNPIIFTYQVVNPVPSASLLTSNTRVATALVGLPTGYTQIPQVGTA